MNVIRILVSSHVPPEIKTVTTSFFENLLSFMKNKTKVHMIWLVYTPERLDPALQKDPDTTILDIHNYKNAVEVIEKEKPDIIYASADWSFVDYALSSAAKLFGIPVFVMTYSLIGIQINTEGRLRSHLTRFFQNSIPTDTEQNKKAFMRRGRFFIYKYLFLLRTQLTLKTNRLLTIFTIWKFVRSQSKKDSKFGGDVIQFLDSESLVQSLLDVGFTKSNLIVTGNPMFDNAYKKLANQKPSGEKNKIISVLLTPSTLYEHGIWTRQQRDTAIKETITKILENKKEMSVTVKIHPSTSILSEYQSIIHSIDPSIPIYQKGEILDFLSNVDVMITFVSSNAEIFALLAKKPIVICNFFNLKGDIFLERNLATECKDPSNLTNVIRQAMDVDDRYEQRREEFIREYLYKWDGNSAERICSELLNLLEKRKSFKQ